MGNKDRGWNGQRMNDNRSGYDEPKLPEGYLKNGYFDTGPSGKTVRTELVWKTAKEIADSLNAGKTQLKKSQLRKYYDYCKNLQSKMHLRNAGFEAIRPEFVKLLGYATNALNKSTPVVPKIFVKFVESNIDKVKNADDFNAFIAHFEMIVAYYPKKD